MLNLEFFLNSEENKRKVALLTPFDRKKYWNVIMQVKHQYEQAFQQEKLIHLRDTYHFGKEKSKKIN
jgi:hypothetical protein